MLGAVNTVHALAPLLASILVLAACGDDSDTSSGAGGDASSTTSASGSTGAGSTVTGSTGTPTGGTGGASASGTGGEASGGGGQGAVIVGGDRPAEVFIPSSYDGSPMPLVVLLHGYTATGAIQELYFRLEPMAEELGFLYVHPDGTVDDGGENFWNATDACCNFYGSSVDDSAYLRGLIEEISGELAVDPRRIHLVGHSNGGFMGYRMACDHADLIASVASLAGATFADDAACAPSEPVATLEIHGTADQTVAYEGGTFGAAYPGAEETAATWAAHGGCDAAATDGSPRDLISATAGAESTVQVWDGCDPGGGTELWTIPEGPHVPALAPTFGRDVAEWLLAHPKP